MIYPTRRLVLLAVSVTVLALIAAALPLLLGALWGVLLVSIAVAIVDARRALLHAPALIARELPKRVRVGAPCQVLYRATLAPTLAALVLDELPAELGGDQRFELSASGLAQRELTRVITPARRGIHALGPIFVDTPSPLGLFVRRAVVREQQVLNVYPGDPRTERGDAISHDVRQELGLRPRRQRGEASEFESLREYTFDDDPRRIDWRASARSRRPVVRTYQVERHHTLIVAVDCGRLMSTHSDGRSKLDHALAAAVSLVRASAQCQDRVGFAAFDQELRAWVPPQRSGLALGAVLEATLPLQPRSCESSYRALAEVMQQRQKKRALLVLLTDFVEGAGAAELRAYLSSLGGRHCVLLVGLRDRLLRELDAPLSQPADREIYRRLVLQDLSVERDLALEQIARAGVHVLDLDPSAISAPLIDRYLRIREAGLL